MPEPDLLITSAAPVKGKADKTKISNHSGRHPITNFLLFSLNLSSFLGLESPSLVFQVPGSRPLIRHSVVGSLPTGFQVA